MVLEGDKHDDTIKTIGAKLDALYDSPDCINIRMYGMKSKNTSKNYKSYDLILKMKGLIKS